MVLLIDNYDSFSYNLYQLIGSVTKDISVIRNDEKTVEQIEALRPSHIILSPGPGRPKDAGICEEVVLHFQGKVPILGVCLGHQAICEAYGMDIVHAPQLMHGKCSSITVNMQDMHTDSSDPFYGLPENIVVARYHSLIADKKTLPDCLLVLAQTKDGEIMAVRHKQYPVFGLQFHPESILTEIGAAPSIAQAEKNGHKMIQNFLKSMKGERYHD